MSIAAMNLASLDLAPLPYPIDALEPVISGRTLSFHHDKHHRAYLETLSKLIAGTELADMSLDQIVTATAGRPDRISIFNNAAQAWNHGFYWNCLKPKGGGETPSTLKKTMEAAFGSVDACKSELVAGAVSQFGSGWAWLVFDGNKLAVLKSDNANDPLTQGLTPILTIDVWEHAYYLDYQNKRANHVNAVIDKLANWEFAAENLEKAMRIIHE
jgi:superoxide dismutase, Fe-Mn family